MNLIPHEFNFPRSVLDERRPTPLEHTKLLQSGEPGMAGSKRGQMDGMPKSQNVKDWFASLVKSQPLT